MKARIRDREALMAVSPAALSAYARTEGWAKVEAYGDHSDIYVADGLPELVLPRTQRLGDYANVVSQLIDIFARVADIDELSLYRDLVTADRDVIRLRAKEGDDGTITMEDGTRFVQGARDMLLAAACSYQNPQMSYRAGANKEAQDYLRRMRLGQTERGSFVVTLLTPVVPPPMQPAFDLGPDLQPDNDSDERKITHHLAGMLEAARQAVEEAIGGEVGAFMEVVPNGVSANLCEALAMMIEPFPTLDVSFVWARTQPTTAARVVYRFSRGDAPILREAARAFRSRKPKPAELISGYVHSLKRDREEAEGTIRLRADIDGKTQSVTAILNQTEYKRAIKAHDDETPILADGDLVRVGQRWYLLNPRITTFVLE